MYIIYKLVINTFIFRKILFFKFISNKRTGDNVFLVYGLFSPWNVCIPNQEFIFYILFWLFKFVKEK